MICDDRSFCEWTATPSRVSLFIRGLKFAAVTAHWSENGFAEAEDPGPPNVDLTGIVRARALSRATIGKDDPAAEQLAVLTKIVRRPGLAAGPFSF